MSNAAIASMVPKIDELWQKLTQDNNPDNMANLDAAISTLSLAASALNNSTWTAEKAGFIDRNISDVHTAPLPASILQATAMGDVSYGVNGVNDLFSSSTRLLDGSAQTADVFEDHLDVVGRGILYFLALVWGNADNTEQAGMRIYINETIKLDHTFNVVNASDNFGTYCPVGVYSGDDASNKVSLGYHPGIRFDTRLRVQTRRATNAVQHRLHYNYVLI